MKSLVLFLVTFLVGAALAFGVRAALHDPHALPSEASAKEGASHAGHSTSLNAQPATINTLCPICGMEVDPSLPVATYEGKSVGFGCAACPPKFAKDPARYGPSALRNEVVKN